MDPDTAFSEMMEAFALGAYDESADHAENLALWLNNGGFPPTLELSTATQKKFTVSEQLAREFCRAACRLVLDQHEAACDPHLPAFKSGETVIFQCRGAPVLGKIIDIDPDTPVAVIQLTPANVFVTVDLTELSRPDGEGLRQAPREPDEP